MTCAALLALDKKWVTVAGKFEVASSYRYASGDARSLFGAQLAARVREHWLLEEI